MNTNQQPQDTTTDANRQPRPVLITGATGGLGLATAEELAALGDSLILAVRDVDRGRAIAEKIRQDHPKAIVEVGELNLASLASIAAFANQLIASQVRPRTIICNAGLQVVDGVEVSPDGHELTMATNVLGHVALLTQLIPHLAPGLDVVTLGSETHRGGLRAFGFPAARFTDMASLLSPPTDPKETSSQAGRVRYSTSKLACIALAYEIERRFGPQGVHAVSFDPGLMPATGLARGYPDPIRKFYTAMVPVLVQFPGANSIDQSAQDLAWLVHHGAEAGLMGSYVSGRTAHRSSPASYTPGIGKDIWDTCCRVAGLEPSYE